MPTVTNRASSAVGGKAMEKASFSSGVLLLAAVMSIAALLFGPSVTPAWAAKDCSQCTPCDPCDTPCENPGGGGVTNCGEGSGVCTNLSGQECPWVCADANTPIDTLCMKRTPSSCEDTTCESYTCASLGGDYCSNMSSCPGGYSYLGQAPGCNACCKSLGPSCGPERQLNVSVDFGDSDKVQGLTPVEVDDGRTVSDTVASLHCRRNQDPGTDHYMYFNVEDEFALQGSRPRLFIYFHYYDAPGIQLNVQYDSMADGPYKWTPGTMTTGTNTWKLFSAYIDDAYFGNRQNNGADFRIVAGGSSPTFYVDLVYVRALPCRSPVLHIAPPMREWFPGELEPRITATGWRDLCLGADSEWPNARWLTDIAGSTDGILADESFGMSDQDRRACFSRISNSSSWTPRFGIETGSLKENHKRGKISFDWSMAYAYEPMRQRGADLDTASFYADEPFFAVRHFRGQKDKDLLLTDEEAVDEFVIWMKLMRDEFPHAQISDIEPAFADPEMSFKDLKWWIRSVSVASVQAGVQVPDYFVLDHDWYEPKCALNDKTARELRDIRRVVRDEARSLLGVIFWGSGALREPYVTNTQWRANVMLQGGWYKSKNIIPDLYSMDDWTAYPNATLPESTYGTYTNVVEHFAKNYVVRKAFSPPIGVGSGRTTLPPGGGGTDVATPSLLVAGTGSANPLEVHLHWRDNSFNETEFQVERQDASGAWQEVGTTGANETDFFDHPDATSPDGSATYNYRVRAVNASTAKCSEYSDPAGITTVILDAPTAIAPSGEVEGDVQTFSWTGVNGADSYHLYVIDDVTNAIVVNEYVTETSFTPAMRLLAGRQHHWKVKGQLGTREGPYSNILFFTPLCGQSATNRPPLVTGGRVNEHVSAIRAVATARDLDCDALTCEPFNPGPMGACDLAGPLSFDAPNLESRVYLTNTGCSFGFRCTDSHGAVGETVYHLFPGDAHDVPTLEGEIESASCSTITGWAWDRSKPNTSTHVRVLNGSSLIALLPADRSRPDLASSLGDDGVHGFSYAVPPSLKDGQPHPIAIRYGDTDISLANSPVTIQCAPDPTPPPNHPPVVTGGRVYSNVRGVSLHAEAFDPDGDVLSCDLFYPGEPDRDHCQPAGPWNFEAPHLETVAYNFVGDDCSIGFRCRDPHGAAAETAFYLSGYESGPTPSYAGFQDDGGCTAISGWMADRNSPNVPLNVDVYDGSALLATVPANLYRADAAAQAGDNGYHAFSLPVPEALINRQPHTMTVRVSGRDVWVPYSPRMIQCTPPNHAPVVTVSGGGECRVPCTAVFSAQASDPDGEPVTLVWSGCASGSGSTVSCPIVAPGTVTAEVTVSDGRGGSATASTSAAGYANRAPTVTLSGPAGCVVPCTVTVSASAADPDNDPLAYEWSGCATGSGQSAACTASAAVSATATVAVSDGQGAATTASHIIAFVAANRPPVVSSVTAAQPTCYPRPGTPCTISVTVSASDPDGDPLSYVWSGCGSGTGATGSCAVTDLSQQTATVTVSDGRGGSVTGSVNVTGVNQPPTVTISGGGQCHPRSNPSGTPPTPCYVPLTASVQDPDGDTVSYAWSGCASGTAPTAQCRVDSLTTFTASLAVKDVWNASASASSSTSRGVNNTPAEPPSEGYSGTGSITIAPSPGTDADGDWIGCYFDYDGADNLTMEDVHFCEGYGQCQPTIRVHLTDPGRSGWIKATCNDGWSDSAGWSTFGVSP